MFTNTDQPVNQQQLLSPITIGNLKGAAMKLLLLTMFILLGTGCFSQNRRIDSLKQEIELHPAWDSTRFQLLSSTSFAYLYAGRLDDAKAYNIRAMEVAKKLNKAWMISTAMRMDGIIENDLRHYPEALNIYREAQKLLEADIRKHPTDIAKFKLMAIYFEIRFTYIKMENYPEAISYSHKAIDIGMQQKAYQAILPIVIELGIIYKRNADYAHAESTYKEALEIIRQAEQQHPPVFNYYDKARVLGNLAELYGTQRNIDKAIQYFQEAEKAIEPVKNDPKITRVVWSVYSNAAFMYKEAGRWDEAFQLLEKSGEAAAKLGGSAPTLHTLTKWTILSEAPDSYMSNKMPTLQQEYIKAIGSFEKLRRDSSNELLSFDSKLQMLTTLSILYEKVKDYDRALSVYKQYVVLKDSMMGSEKQREFMRKDIQFRFAKREDSLKLQQQLTESELQQQSLLAQQREQALLLSNKEKDLQRLSYLARQAALEKASAEKEKEVLVQSAAAKQHLMEAELKDKQLAAQNTEINYNRKMNLALIAGTILLLLAVCLTFYSQRKTARLNKTVSSQNMALQEQKAVLTSQQEKLTNVMKELNHRVKNNLQVVSSLLNLQSYRLQDTEAIAAITESKQRVQAMSLLHQRLYKSDDLTRINMKEYIGELASFLIASYGYDDNSLNLYLDVDEEWLDVEKAMPLGLIINELVTNAFKYAYEHIDQPSLRINLKDTGDSLELLVADNGKGIVKEDWNSEDIGSSFGRQLVKALCGQLNATEQLSVHNGSSFVFKIPKAA